ncbi:hypothetical protein E8A66_00050 [Vibrio cholerae]|uniref:Uncharacterized protein n=5 Tax=Gammaproteobacteria TaxID=1236 RepID=Q9KQS4_VIBCH|nr:hypothetical protein VC_1924 [Vibrio cholerae O1 biovar El Tor str. N16961]ACP06154.1 conserved hypothetical protein [Vibrio cholerae M66-2]ACP10032.1 conserved hypothetical protein [Vibrio cholerae O395]AET27016.1 conserved hypothetical protein [Vibrio cholerae O1 str. 2010EL-1786]AIT29906.1 hypothetical protein EN18_12740 [Vibrio cholerae]AKA00373.1 hypothetical protein IR04_14780 [Vibrio cholerae O1 biovar El Tor]ALJ63664.1 hypothetical protein N900_04745 [Vibrio cholerae O1 str. KW3]A
MSIGFQANHQKTRLMSDIFWQRYLRLVSGPNFRRDILTTTAGAVELIPGQSQANLLKTQSSAKNSTKRKPIATLKWGQYRLFQWNRGFFLLKSVKRDLALVLQTEIAIFLDASAVHSQYDVTKGFVDKSQGCHPFVVSA